MTEQSEQPEAPRIEFPCDYPIKVLGRQGEAFRPAVEAVFERHAPDFDRQRITVRDSRQGRFVAITITITATGREQLEALHRDLLATGLVQMVL
jgi:putative lipoic acid-binding regulatory protein